MTFAITGAQVMSDVLRGHGDGDQLLPGQARPACPLLNQPASGQAQCTFLYIKESLKGSFQLKSRPQGIYSPQLQMD